MNKLKFILNEIWATKYWFFAGVILLLVYLVIPGVLDVIIEFLNNNVFVHLIENDRHTIVGHVFLAFIISWTYFAIYTAKDVSTVFTFNVLVISVIYFIDRNYINHWDYSQYELSINYYGDKPYFLDLILFPSFVCLSCVKLVNGFPKERNFKVRKEGFILDNDSVSDDNDLLGSKRIVDQIETRIKSTDLTEESFIIGLEGPWGHGKSSHMKMLANRFSENEWIKINFKSWYAEGPEQIVFEYFKEFRNAIKPYNSKLARSLLFYSQDLLKFYKNNKLIGPVNLTLELFRSSPTYQKYYDSINDQLSKIDQRIIIFLDDLDRLDPKQVWEILRLVKVTGSFNNTVFVLAYDKQYVGKGIEQINPHESYRFIEKVVSYEHHLVPVPTDLMVSQILILLRSNEVLSKNQFEQLKAFIESDINVIDPFIRNLRDVKRFVNSFTSSLMYAPIEELNISDFFVLELIRYKFYPVYSMLYSQRDIIFTDGEGPFIGLRPHNEIIDEGEVFDG